MAAASNDGRALFQKPDTASQEASETFQERMTASFQEAERFQMPATAASQHTREYFQQTKAAVDVRGGNERFQPPVAAASNDAHGLFQKPAPAASREASEAIQEPMTASSREAEQNQLPATMVSQDARERFQHSMAAASNDGRALFQKPDNASQEASETFQERMTAPFQEVERFQMPATAASQHTREYFQQTKAAVDVRGGNERFQPPVAAASNDAHDLFQKPAPAASREASEAIQEPMTASSREAERLRLPATMASQDSQACLQPSKAVVDVREGRERFPQPLAAECNDVADLFQKPLTAASQLAFEPIQEQTTAALREAELRDLRAELSGARSRQQLLERSLAAQGADLADRERRIHAAAKDLARAGAKLLRLQSARHVLTPTNPATASPQRALYALPVSRKEDPAQQLLEEINRSLHALEVVRAEASPQKESRPRELSWRTKGRDQS
ncbi:unnamed protein product [Effrenium voratum]|uniref:Uncharacterized protein n=1 Tax=Effrenium voratum TaxID=2562239 RepID=A0AA36HWR8_9DINO|nr:unnamed protein product [Effrenium voratum]